jgi:hypothetical protein
VNPPSHPKRVTRAVSPFFESRIKQNNMNSSLNDYRKNRDRLLSAIVETFANDERFVAAWLTGSFSQNNEDAVSDLDLSLVVSDTHSETCAEKLNRLVHKLQTNDSIYTAVLANLPLFTKTTTMRPKAEPSLLLFMKNHVLWLIGY